MAALGLSWDQISYAPQQDFSLYKYVSDLDMYAAPGTVQQLKNKIVIIKMLDEAAKHRYIELSYWNTSLFAANLSSRYDYPDTVKHFFTIKMNRSCEALNSTQLSKLAIMDSFLKIANISAENSNNQELWASFIEQGLIPLLEMITCGYSVQLLNSQSKLRFPENYIRATADSLLQNTALTLNAHSLKSLTLTCFVRGSFLYGTSRFWTISQAKLKRLQVETKFLYLGLFLFLFDNTRT
jgi:hypothetical protein